MDRHEFELLFSRLTQEQIDTLIKEYENLLNAHNPQKTRLKTA